MYTKERNSYLQCIVVCTRHICTSYVLYENYENEASFLHEGLTADARDGNMKCTVDESNVFAYINITADGGAMYGQDPCKFCVEVKGVKTVTFDMFQDYGFDTHTVK